MAGRPVIYAGMLDAFRQILASEGALHPAWPRCLRTAAAAPVSTGTLREPAANLRIPDGRLVLGRQHPLAPTFECIRCTLQA